MKFTGKKRAVVVIDGCPQVGCDEVRQVVRSVEEAIGVLRQHTDSHATYEATIEFEEQCGGDWIYTSEPQECEIKLGNRWYYVPLSTRAAMDSD